MKKLIPLKFQYVISWLPYANEFVHLMFFYNCIKATETGKHLFWWFLRTLVILILFGIVDVVVRMVALPGILTQVWKYISFYLTSLACALNVYDYQKKNWDKYFM